MNNRKPDEMNLPQMIAQAAAEQSFDTPQLDVQAADILRVGVPDVVLGIDFLADSLLERLRKHHRVGAARTDQNSNCGHQQSQQAKTHRKIPFPKNIEQ